MRICKAKAISILCFGNAHSFRNDREDFYEVRQFVKRKEMEIEKGVKKILHKNAK